MSTGDIAAVGLDAGVLEAETLAVRDRTDREQDVGALGDASVVAVDGHLVAVAHHARGPSALEQAHAASQEVLLERGRDLGVLARQHLLTTHDERHLAPHRLEQVDELHARHARSRSRSRATAGTWAGTRRGWS